MIQAAHGRLGQVPDEDKAERLPAQARREMGSDSPEQPQELGETGCGGSVSRAGFSGRAAPAAARLEM
jgi:hypothetical protein